MMKRMCPRHRQLVPHRPRDVSDTPQRWHELVTDLGHTAADTCPQLNHRLHQLGGDVLDRLFCAGLQEPHRARGQIARGRVDQHELEFCADRRSVRRMKHHLLGVVGVRAGIVDECVHVRFRRRGTPVPRSWLIGRSIIRARCVPFGVFSVVNVVRNDANHSAARERDSQQLAEFLPLINP